MFEIRLDGADAEKEKEERGEEEEEQVSDGRCFFTAPHRFTPLSLSLCPPPPLPEQKVDPLNQTLSFQQGEELKLRDWSEVRRGWRRRTPQTLLNALCNMDVDLDTVGTEPGAANL